MKALFVMSSNYQLYQGELWTTSSYNNEMWDEYLQVFDELILFVPIKKVLKLSLGSKKASKEKVSFIDSSLKFFNIKKFFSGIYGSKNKTIDFAIIHSPSVQAEIAYKYVKKNNIPYIVEVRGEQLMKKEFLREKKIVLATLISKFIKKSHMKHINNSNGCIYVSEYLSEKYKPVKKIPYNTISDFRLPSEYMVKIKKKQKNRVTKILNVGSFNPAKDHRTLLYALKELENYPIELHLVGEGKLKKEIQDLIIELNLEVKVIFHGFIPWGKKLLDMYDQSDIFVLTSITEGMPRVVLEALARGLPVVSTRVSGVSELLPPECIVEVKNYRKIAKKIIEVINDNEYYETLSKRGLKKIQNYSEDKLRNKKIDFLKNITS